MGKKFYENIKDKSLYHFTSFDNAEYILGTGGLRFGDLRNTNDINEINREVFTMISSTYFKEEIYKFKVLCFTQNNFSFGFENDPLWGYYAQKGEGVCFVLDRDKLCESFIKLHGLKWRKKVRYKKNFTNSVFDCKVSAKEEVGCYIKHNHKELFFTKSFAWNFESEYRMIIKSTNEESPSLNIMDALVGVIICLPKEEEYCDSNVYKMVSKYVDKKNIYRYSICIGKRTLTNERKEVYNSYSFEKK